MIDILLTVMISALSLAQPGHAAITTNELPPPAGMVNADTKAAPEKSGAAVKAQPTTTPKTSNRPDTRPQTSAANANGVVTDDAKPVFVKPAPASSDAEASQPTKEVKTGADRKTGQRVWEPGPCRRLLVYTPKPPVGKQIARETALC